MGPSIDPKSQAAMDLGNTGIGMLRGVGDVYLEYTKTDGYVNSWSIKVTRPDPAGRNTRPQPFPKEDAFELLRKNYENNVYVTNKRLKKFSNSL